MFSRFCTKSVLCLIVVTLAIPSGLLLYPKKTEAASNDCLVRIGATLGINKVVSKLTGKAVPVQQSTAIESEIAGSFIQDCVIGPLVTQLAKAMLYNITVSTVEWINSGFQGNPGFVRDFKGLMSDTADQVIGEFLLKEAPFLCSAFAFQVRIELAQSYLPYRQRAQCTLKDVQRNIQGFADNNNGWENWLEVTTIPQNNQYGAFVLAQDEISKRIIDANYLQKTYLDWGNGFKDWMGCDEIDEETGEPLCERETPGAIVEAMLQKTFVDAPIDQLGVASNLNAILDALANQFTKQIVNGTVGLLGGKKAPNEKTYGTSWGSVNYDNALKANNNDPSLNQAIENSLGQTGADLAPYFTEPEAIETTEPVTPPDDTETIAPEEQNIGLSIITETRTVNSDNPFSHEVDLISNYYQSGLKVKMTLKKNGNPIPLANVFVDSEITFGRSDVGYKVIPYPDTPNSIIASILWGPLSVFNNAKYIFKFHGSKNDGAQTGEYVMETILMNSNDQVIGDKVESKFTIE